MCSTSGKKVIKSNPLQITLMLKPKTSSVILEILKILIQNQLIAGKVILKPIAEKTRGIASLQKNGL